MILDRLQNPKDREFSKCCVDITNFNAYVFGDCLSRPERYHFSTLAYSIYTDSTTFSTEQQPVCAALFQEEHWVHREHSSALK